jgi:membrane protein implicated in regulation of membrane protease activity
MRIPVTIPAFTAGKYSVRAQVSTGTGQVAVVVGTSSYPWGLFVSGLIVLLVVCIALWRYMRRRRNERQLGPGPDGGEGAIEAVGEPREVART